MRLAGRVATVTGAGRGMGESIARAFAREGAAVVVSDIDLDGAERVAEDICKAGGRAHAIRVDVGEDADAERFGCDSR